ncbi:MAG: symmetrical bis(5'-nucleosyl)-tetraphosphatase [Gammaproteobacteria bacterium]
MATYAIGDLQGCYAELQDLLELINFDSHTDRLWFTGDIVNRGPDSLACLRFVQSLGTTAVTVLGNHDLHLLAIAAGHGSKHRKDTLDEILAAPDRDALMAWLSAQPLLVEDPALGFTMVHAGLHPQWDRSLTTELAQEVTAMLANDDTTFFQSMYGNEPDNWDEHLQGRDRIRFITNCLTRLRYCKRDGRIDMREKNSPDKARPGLIPWFIHPDRKSLNDKIIFGHWSTLRLIPTQDYAALNVYPLDGGCLWGGTLIALRLEDEQQFSVPSRQADPFPESNN